MDTIDTQPWSAFQSTQNPHITVGHHWELYVAAITSH